MRVIRLNYGRNMEMSFFGGVFELRSHVEYSRASQMLRSFMLPFLRAFGLRGSGASQVPGSKGLGISGFQGSGCP